jgi:hypothetical protein
MIAVVLLYVGAVLLVNGVWLVGSTVRQFREQEASEAAAVTGPGTYMLLGDREVAVMNLFTGGIGLIIALFSILRAPAGPAGIVDIEFGGLVLLFAFTYLYVAANQFLRADGVAFGWYCLFVAITAVPTAIITLVNSNGHVWPVWLGLDWVVWAILWFLFFLLLAVKRPIARLTGIVTVLVAIVTAWVPGYLLLTGYLSSS